MPLDRDQFRNDPQYARDFSASPDGAILRLAAAATAATIRTLIAGHLIVGGTEQQDATLIIAPDYQAEFDADEEVSIFTSLAPLLIEYEILGTTDLVRHSNAIEYACKSFGIANCHNDMIGSARQLVAIFSNADNQATHENFVALSTINYDLSQAAIVSGTYALDGYAVVPSVELRTLCGTSWSERLRARRRTRSEEARRHAFERMMAAMQMAADQ